MQSVMRKQEVKKSTLRFSSFDEVKKDVKPIIKSDIVKTPFEGHGRIKVSPGQTSLFNDYARKCTKKAISKYYSIYTVSCTKTPWISRNEVITTHSFYLFMFDKVSDDVVNQCESSFARNRNSIRDSIRESIQPIMPAEAFDEGVFGISDWKDKEFYVVPSIAPREFELEMRIERQNVGTTIAIHVLLTLEILRKTEYEKRQEWIGQSLKTERLWDSFDNPKSTSRK